MLNRNVSLSIFVCLALSVAAVAQDQGNEYLFQFATPPSTSTQFLGYLATANPLNTFVTGVGPSGIAAIIPQPNGSGFYLIGSTGTSPLQSVDAAFSLGSFHTINGLGAPPTAAAVTPDGKYLLVGADLLYVISTSSNSIVASLQMPGLPNFVNGQTLANGQTGLCMSCWIAVSHDSQTAYVLTNFGGGQISSYNLGTLTKNTQQYNTPSGDMTAIGISPLGGLYAAGGNAIYQLDPVKLTLIQQTALSFYPGPLHFSPDGTMMYATNLNPGSGGRSLMQYNLATNSPNYWPGTAGGVATPVPFDDVYVVSNSRLFAYSSTLAAGAQTALYDVTASPFSAVQSTSLSLPAITLQNIQAVAISNEVPARYLFLLVANGNQTNLYRMNLNTNTIDLSTLAGLNSGVMEFASVPPTTGAANFIQFNNNQTIQPNTVSLPFEVRVLNAIGQPVFGQAVVYSTDPTSGTTITAPGQTTNADGYTQTTITAPTAPGTYTVTATAGSAATTFTFTVPGTVTTGGGSTSTGTPLLSIVTGDGQLLNPDAPPDIQIPLTVLVVDNNGKPQPNIAVTFAVTAGNTISIDNPVATTDVNGQAYTYAFAQSLGVASAPQPNTITATATIPQGTFSVNFSETTFLLNSNQFGATGAPQLSIIVPTNQPYQITLPQGTPVPNAIEATIYSGSVFGSGVPQPVPGVGIFIQGSPDPTQPPTTPVSCQGSSDSDATGTAHCNLVASCPAAGTTLPLTVPITINIGNASNFAGSVVITGGGATKINILGGNNQSGTPATVLAPLTATITDGCGAPAGGVPVTWTVTQGSATLSKTISSSTTAGQVSTNIAFGQTPGPVTVKLSLNSSTSVTYTLTNQVVVAGITLLSGSPQTASEGQAFASPLIFVVKDTNGNPLPGIQVTFSVAGSATVNPNSATTNTTTGQVSTTVTAGNSPGSVTVTASAGTFTASASLTVQAPGPTITVSSFQNAASFAPGLVECGLAVVTGSGIAPNISGVVTGSSSFGPMSYSVNGFSLSINGIAAPISSVSNENGIQQATFQTPCELGNATSATAVVTSTTGVQTTVTNIPVQPAQPGIFTFQGTGGIVYGAVIRAADGSYVTPSNYAHRGETYYLVVTGLGETTPPIVSNSTGLKQDANAQMVVGVNNAGVPVVSAQYAQGLIGVYLVGFQIPLSFNPGTNVPLAVAAIVNGQVIYGNSVFLPGIQ